MNSLGFIRWVKRYHHAPVSDLSRPDWKRDEVLSNAYLVASNLKRAQESAHIGFGKPADEIIPNLREMDIPRYKLPFQLRAFTWVYLNRLLWMLGKQGAFESYQDAKVRARDAAEQLVSLARQHSNVIAVGHGYLNLHLRYYLRKQGWCVIEKNNDYWGMSRLTFKQR